MKEWMMAKERKKKERREEKNGSGENGRWKRRVREMEKKRREDRR